MLNTPPYGAKIINVVTSMIGMDWYKWVSNLYQYLNRQVDYTVTSVQAPTTGFSITMLASVGSIGSVLTLNPAGTLATGTILLPKQPTDGQVAEVSTTATVTSLTVSGNGATIKNAPTTLLAGNGFAYYYSAASAAWFRRY